MDAFLLKIVIEGRLGWPVHLISDGLHSSIESALNLSGVAAAVFQALASGEAHIYPEVCQPATATFEQALHCVAAGLLGQSRSLLRATVVYHSSSARASLHLSLIHI